jgi:myotubularin-related protein 1/2
LFSSSQWIDCVWQLTRQFRQAFEFNERYLLSLLLHVYSARFGNFLCNSYKERLVQDVSNLTPSVWSYLTKSDNLCEVGWVVDGVLSSV